MSIGRLLSFAFRAYPMLTSSERMDQQNEYAKRVTPEKQFHMMNLGQGWDPLCKVLGKPVPRSPFPRVNDADAIDKFVIGVMKDAALRVSCISAEESFWWCTC